MKFPADETVQLVLASFEVPALASHERILDMSYALVAGAEKVLTPSGSFCVHVPSAGRGMDAYRSEAALFDYCREKGLRLRNRIVVVRSARAEPRGVRPAGRTDRRVFECMHETVLWFTKADEYVFNLDAVRVPQKYPGKKHYKGPKRGEYSGNPLGKNPGDFWSPPIGNGERPGRMPRAVVERLVLALTGPGDLVMAPAGPAAAVVGKLGRKYVKDVLECTSA